MKIIEFANRHEQILNDLITSKRFQETDNEIVEGRRQINRIRLLPIPRQQEEIPKSKEKKILASWKKLLPKQ